MDRDLQIIQMIESVWKLGVKDVPKFSRLTGKHAHVDAVIIGSGITGLSAAMNLSEGNLKVAVVEAGKIASGMTLNSLAKVSVLQGTFLNQLSGKHGDTVIKHYLKLNQLGLEEIRDNVKQYNIDCDWHNVSQFTYTDVQNEVRILEKEAKLLQNNDFPARVVTSTGELPIPILSAVMLPNQGEFNSYKYCLGLVKELVKRGVQFFEDSRAIDVAYSTKPNHIVKTAEGSIEANHVIVATHMPFLNRSGHFGVCKPIKSYCIAFEMKEGSAPRNGYQSASTGIDSKSIRSADDGKFLLVSGCEHPAGEPPSGSTIRCYEDLERFARENFKVGDVVRQWSGVDYTTADLLPYIGYLHHGTDTMYTAVGFHNSGMTQAAAAGYIISQLILNPNRDMPDWVKTFDARRWDLAKSTLQMLGFQFSVGKHYAIKPIEDWIIKSLPDVEDLVRDTGAVCRDKVNGNIVAAYRDVDGGIHCVSPNCGHMGCRLSWSQGDKQWECPCHGSIFSVDGEIMHGPATTRLPNMKH